MTRSGNGGEAEGVNDCMEAGSVDFFEFRGSGFHGLSEPQGPSLTSACGACHGPDRRRDRPTARAEAMRRSVRSEFAERSLLRETH
jgi:hypothetical protein